MQNVQQLKAELRQGHVLHTLISEHELILQYLGELDTMIRKLVNMKNYAAGSEMINTMKKIMHHLLAAELHHQREEKVLFPALENKGIDGPPQVMTQEHEVMRGYKQELNRLLAQVAEKNWDDFLFQFAKQGSNLIQTLRDHIAKENNILFPMALQAIQDEEEWLSMQRECDKIGYCCFTPKA